LKKKSSGNYFKAGAYTQSNCSKEKKCSAENFGEVRIYKLLVDHSDSQSLSALTVSMASANETVAPPIETPLTVTESPSKEPEQAVTQAVTVTEKESVTIEPAVIETLPSTSEISWKTKVKQWLIAFSQRTSAAFKSRTELL
jgi:hypothetical protein